MVSEPLNAVITSTTKLGVGLLLSLVMLLSVGVYGQSGGGKTHNNPNSERGSNYVLWLGTSIPAGAQYPQESCKANGYYCVNNSKGQQSLGLRNGNTRCLTWTVDEYKASFTYKGEAGKKEVTAAEFKTALDKTYERAVLPFIRGEQLVITDGTTAAPNGIINPEAIKVSTIVIDHGYNDYKNVNSAMENQESIDWTSRDRNNFVGAFNYLVDQILAINPNIRIIVGGYFDYSFVSSNKPLGRNLCDLQTLIAEYFGFELFDVWKYSGICYDEFVPGTSTYLEDLNAKYGTNFTPRSTWCDSSGNLRNHFVWCPDGIHPHSDPTGKTNKRLNEVYTELLKNILGVYKYLLTYKVDDDVFKSDSVEYNSTLTPIAEPSKEGYTFSGWSEIPETMPAHDVEVNGSFTINKYLLTYKVDDEVFKSDSVEYNSTLTPIAEPSKEGYTFSGWSEIPETMPAHDVEVIGSFVVESSDIKSYYIDKDKNGTSFYSINGLKLDKPKKGLVILKTRQGVRKIIIR